MYYNCFISKTLSFSFFPQDTKKVSLLECFTNIAKTFLALEKANLTF